ncbi:hypothetical protein ACPPVU_07695 [Mucilaginibacter sp. McL0603]|uniref:hypothetical protein n=1 Tax=Mucilaginibacter sp. McL0603 TaxID=3415670 RepID=UPI003CF47C26
MVEKRTFLDFFNDPSPALNVKFSNVAEEESREVLVKNILGSPIDKKGKKYIESICKDVRLNDFFEFYTTHDGFEFCKPVYPDNYLKTPLFKLISSLNISNFNKQYIKGGKWAWSIDLNKSKTLYRGNDTWVAFAEIGQGPACLTIFLTGENAGCIYLVAPQPAFNILKPIAKTFNLFLDRVAKDPAAFLRLVRSYVVMQGTDGQNYGLIPVEYLSNSNEQKIV